MRAKSNLLITGAPGVGKTTLVRGLVDRLQKWQPGGFYTAEIRVCVMRQGFELVSLTGEHALLSHVDIKSRQRVGKYGVDIEAFESFLDGLCLLESQHRLVIVDEIGKMECLSHEFKKLIQQLMDSSTIVLATIALKGEDFVAQLKDREDCELHVLKPANHSHLLENLALRASELLNLKTT